MSQQDSRASVPVLLLAVSCLILAGAVVVLVVQQSYPDAIPVGFMSSVDPGEHSKGIGSAAGHQSSTLPVSALDFEDVERLVGTLPPENRAQVLADPAAFAELVKREAVVYCSVYC